MKKKILLSVLITAMIASFASCGNTAKSAEAAPYKNGSDTSVGESAPSDGGSGSSGSSSSHESSGISGSSSGASTGSSSGSSSGSSTGSASGSSSGSSTGSASGSSSGSSTGSASGSSSDEVTNSADGSSSGGSSEGSSAAAADSPSVGAAAEAPDSPSPTDSASGEKSDSRAETTAAPAAEPSYEMAPEAAAEAGAFDGSREKSFDDESAWDAAPEAEAPTDSAESWEEYRPERERSQARAGLLTGGEWRDNSNFVFWQSLFRQRNDWKDLPQTWNFNTTDRVYVRVTASDAPACGLTVKLASGQNMIWQSITDSRGEAFLFWNTGRNSTGTPDKILVEAPDGRTITQDIPKDRLGTDIPIDITIPGSSAMRKNLDLMLMVDTTGSMGDELRYLQTELASVIDRVKSDSKVDVQLSVNFYRDNGDDYVVRDFGFTSNLNIALEHLEDQRSGGGGDYPEAVTRALDNGINGHQWRDNSEKLMILVLDAPPHREDGAAELEKLIRNASAKGIRIIPVASSGVDTDTEFLCRAMAMATGGTYTFLTDDSGIGNSHLEPTIGNYTVEKLNDMLVRIINEYFSQASRTGTQTSGSQQSSGYRTDWFKTHDYYTGAGLYGTKLICTERGLTHFFEDYGYKTELEDFASRVDFKKNVIAVHTELLSSGSIGMGKGGISVTIENGMPVFSYKLDMPATGTADIATMFCVAEIPEKDIDMTFTDAQTEAMDEVDSTLSEVLRQTRNMSKSERAGIIEKTLFELADAGLIYPDSLGRSNDIYSFEYKLEGVYGSVTGGVQLVPFDD